MKKLLSLMLIVALSLGTLALASCGEEDVPTGGFTHEQAMDLLEKADETMTSLDASYAYKTDINVSCTSNPELNDMLSQSLGQALGAAPAAVYDGENRKSTVNMLGTNAEVCYIDGYTYVKVSAYGVNMMYKVAMNAAERDEFHGTAELPIKYNLFKNADVKQNDGNLCYTVTWSGITFQGKEELTERFEALGNADGVTMGFDEASLVCEIKDGKYESIALVFPFTMPMTADSTLSIELSMVLDFDYENFEPVTLPADADKYTEIDLARFKEIFNIDDEESEN